MPCPPEIISAFESVVDIYFSAVRHRDRAAFILCDNLVEMACKARAHQHDQNFNRRSSFPQSIEAPGVKTRLAKPLRDRLRAFHTTRNDFQHNNPAGTVDASLCADAIESARTVLTKLWPDTTFPTKLACGLRVARVYGTDGDAATQAQFEERMASYDWRIRDERVSHDAVPIKPGIRNHWGYALHHRTPEIEQLLNEILGIL